MISRKRGMLLGALTLAAAFVSMSYRTPAHAQLAAGLPVGTVVPVTGHGGIIVAEDAMQEVADMMNQAARDELARQSRNPSIDPGTIGAIDKAAGNIFH